MGATVSGIASPAALRALVDDTVSRIARELDGTTLCGLLLSALGGMRAGLARDAGYRAMRQFDDWLFENLTRRRLRRLAFGGPARVELPRGCGRARVPERARLMLANALDVVAARARAAAAPALLLVAADALLDALVDVVGGVPAFDALLRHLDLQVAADAFEASVSGSEVRLQ